MSTVLEILLTIVIIVALLLLIGMSPESILTLVAVILLGLAALASAVFILFFVVTDISLLIRKKVRGRFLRVDEEGRYDRAVYSVDGQEYTCLFPAETYGRSRIYKENSEYMLLIPRNGRKNNAYDRHSLVIITIGSVVSVLFLIVLIIGARYIISQF